MGVDKILAGTSIAAVVGGSLYAGYSAHKAAQQEADALEGQASLERAELQEESRRQSIQDRKFLAKQGLMFVKGGVSLAGSPMLVLEETAEEAAKQKTARTNQLNARYNFGVSKAQRVESSGRSKLIGGIFGGIASGIAMTQEARRLKIF